jgi:lysophospholipase L1-like esterase
MHRAKFAVFALLPIVILLGAAECGVRLWDLDRPALRAGGLGPMGPDSPTRIDPLVGWSLRPGFHGKTGDGERVTINSLGFRSPEMPRRKSGPGELRILSLGESTTFGTGVDDDQTYSALLETFLRERRPGRLTRVLNAGVSAWSSTQSLIWLKARGLEFDPDVILFYHELNDYLPATIRDAGLTEIEIVLTDRQIYSSWPHRLSRTLTAWSAGYRFAVNAAARHRIARLALPQDGEAIPASPLTEIGVPDGIYFGGADIYRGSGRTASKIPSEELLLGRRVTPAERMGNLEELSRLCRQRGIDLVILHPSYSVTAPHECLLTGFCRDNGLPMLETYGLLRPEGDPAAHFLDPMHPDAEGHRLLADALADLLITRGIVTE